jgi:hypothetical protein
MVNDRAAIALSPPGKHNIMKARVNEQETCGAAAVCNGHHGNLSRRTHTETSRASAALVRAVRISVQVILACECHARGSSWRAL